MAADDCVRGLIIGGLIGAALGILYAPKSGKETREEISHSAEELLKELRRQFGKGGGDFSSEEENIKEEGHRYIRELTVLSFEKIKSVNDWRNFLNY